MDLPNHRSSHSVPTPRGGGAALVLAVGLFASLEVYRLRPAYSLQLAVLGAVLLVLALVGWRDDHESMPVATRFGTHVAAGFAVAILVNAIHPLTGSANVLWLILWLFWTTASINIVNFMDGIDGMVASQGFVYGLYLVILLPDSSFARLFAAVLAASCLGFLLWNWAPARIFLGDVGSGPLGLFFAIAGALALGGAPLPLIFLPLFPLYLDALMTLLRRMGRGEPITTAHRSHLYQRVANSGVGHAPTTAMYTIASIIGAATGIGVRSASPGVMAAAIVTYVFLVTSLWLAVDRRFPLPLTRTSENSERIT
jgi:UDP-N-acetylmuramyl pentapeptide phosphotransferase/UDP-N-acetylglucosamine-1-phosphate transferase